MVHSNILDVIGNTPIVKLNRIGKTAGAEVYAKLEFMNPGGSIKDRIGGWLIEDAEKRGVLRPGGTIVEGTSGNTGVALAIASAIKGYKCVFVLPDKMSQEKIKNLRAFGARVVVTPTAVEPEDPRSYYSVSRRLAQEIPNAIYVDQYNNLANRDCHEKTTGPEILKQMPDVDALIIGIGTGGTICGIGRHIKKHKPSVKIIAVDPIGSIVYEYYKTGKALTKPKTYKIEGIGEDFIPKNYDLSVIDDMVQVEDKESFLMTRDLLTKEGIYSGISSGSAVVGALKWIGQKGNQLKGKKVLVILPDSGNRYLSKVYDDDWMREAGFLDSPSLGTVADLLDALNIRRDSVITARQSEKVSQVIARMRDKGISQLPVEDDQGWIKGIIEEGRLLAAIYEQKIKVSDPIESLINANIEFVSLTTPIEKVSSLMTQGRVPLVSSGKDRPIAILTKIDVLAYLGSRSA